MPRKRRTVGGNTPKDKPERTNIVPQPLMIKRDITLTPDPIVIQLRPQPIEGPLLGDPELEDCVRAMKAGGPYQEKIKEYAKRLVRRDLALLGEDATATEASRPPKDKDLTDSIRNELRGSEVEPDELDPRGTGGDKGQTLEAQVSEILTASTELTSAAVVARLIKGFGRKTGASTVRSTTAWKNRAQQKPSTRLPPSGAKSFDGGMEVEYEGPTPDHYTILEGWQQVKTQDVNAKWPPKTTHVVEWLRDKRDPNDVPTEARARELLQQAEAFFRLGAD